MTIAATTIVTTNAVDMPSIVMALGRFRASIRVPIRRQFLNQPLHRQTSHVDLRAFITKERIMGGVSKRSVVLASIFLGASTALADVTGPAGGGQTHSNYQPSLGLNYI